MDYLIDTHCHLNHRDFSEDLDNVLERAKDAGVGRIVCVGYDLESSLSAVELARTNKDISASVGIHPHDALEFTPEVERQIGSLAADRDHVVAIGETGLDYYRSLSPKEVQHEAFRRHIALAHETDLPLVVHSREAYEDVYAILKEMGLPRRGAVMHCFQSDVKMAHDFLGLGCYLGVDGPITYKNAQILRDTFSTLPLDRLILETDAPYLTPHPYRGQRNEPSYLPLISTGLAEILGIKAEEVIETTTANAATLFFQG